jgi:hypothetical protein
MLMPLMRVQKDTFSDQKAIAKTSSQASRALTASGSEVYA